MSTLEIHPRPSIPHASPHLMPFHIAHDGPAPFSTYFHPKPAPPKFGADGQHEHPPRERTSASFRGRAIEGVVVELPEGYTGVVMQGESGSSKAGTQTKEDAAKEAKKKALKDEKRGKGRRTKARVVVDEEEDGDEDLNGMRVDEVPVPDEAPPARPLVPTGTFESFVLWGADHPVDDAMDEYVKGLTEWTRLAAEVRGVAFFAICNVDALAQLHKPLPI